MATLEERAFGHEPAMSEYRLFLLGVREQAKSLVSLATQHEETMRVLIKMLSKRAKIIEYLQSRIDRWRNLHDEENRKRLILESRIRNDTRSLLSIEAERDEAIKERDFERAKFEAVERAVERLCK